MLKRCSSLPVQHLKTRDRAHWKYFYIFYVQIAGVDKEILRKFTLHLLLTKLQRGLITPTDELTTAPYTSAIVIVTYVSMFFVRCILK